MKKAVIVLFVLFLICGMSILSFAQTAQVKSTKKVEVATEVIKGKIISINTANNEITLQESKTAVEKTIALNSKAISALKMGDEVKVTLKKGSNSAVSVKKVVKKAASVK